MADDRARDEGSDLHYLRVVAGASIVATLSWVFLVGRELYYYVVGEGDVIMLVRVLIVGMGAYAVGGLFVAIAQRVAERRRGKK